MASLDESKKSVRTFLNTCDQKTSEIKVTHEHLVKLANSVNRAKAHGTVVLRGLETMPESAAGDMKEEDWSVITVSFDLQKEILSSFPMTAAPTDLIVFDSGILTASTGATGSFTQVVLKDPEPVRTQWLGTIVTEERNITNREVQADEIESKLQRFLSGRHDRFRLAKEQLDLYSVGSLDASSVAITMRNVLDQLKGDLISKARKQANESVKWPEIASRLSLGGSGSSYEAALLNQKTTFDNLKSILSNLAKATPAAGHTVESTYFMFLDFLEALFALLDPSIL